MTEDLSLFGDDTQALPQAQAPRPLATIADWQVDLLRIGLWMLAA